MSNESNKFFLIANLSVAAFIGYAAYTSSNETSLRENVNLILENASSKDEFKARFALAYTKILIGEGKLPEELKRSLRYSAFFTDREIGQQFVRTIDNSKESGEELKNELYEIDLPYRVFIHIPGNTLLSKAKNIETKIEVTKSFEVNGKVVDIIVPKIIDIQENGPRSNQIRLLKNSDRAFANHLKEILQNLLPGITILDLTNDYNDDERILNRTLEVWVGRKNLKDL